MKKEDNDADVERLCQRGREAAEIILLELLVEDLKAINLALFEILAHAAGRDRHHPLI